MMGCIFFLECAMDPFGLTRQLLRGEKPMRKIPGTVTRITVLLAVVGLVSCTSGKSGDGISILMKQSKGETGKEVRNENGTTTAF